MPHNLYLHSGLVLSRKIRRGSRQALHEAIWYNRIESAGALLIAFFINLAVVSTNAANFFNTECASLVDGPFACLTPDAFDGSANVGQPGRGESCSLPGGPSGSGKCGALGLQTEGFALKGVLGSSALYVWAIGLLAAGQASTMTCTYAGQIIMGGCVHIELRPWKRVALTRIAALGPALVVSTTTISNQTLFNNINEYLNVLQSVQLPFAMLPVLHFAASPTLLGEFRSSVPYLCFMVILALLMVVMNVYLIVSFLEVRGSFSSASERGDKKPVPERVHRSRIKVSLAVII
uniref:Uncharacterized protein n=1 Tax=Strombidinopsis acuminata TaxID=141414 RepID=A0A7S3WDA8_9SPIT|mmetsp:Transcript_25744/g.35018  ORF Transcript_25744/g.35018 Transcript_25744/m.35018 type:complete len:292 (-) Transcript_25744:50-925(-)